MNRRTLILAALITLGLWLGGCSLILEHDDSPLLELRAPQRFEWSIGNPADLAAGRQREPIRRELTLEDVRPPAN